METIVATGILGKEQLERIKKNNGVSIYLVPSGLYQDFVVKQLEESYLLAKKESNDQYLISALKSLTGEFDEEPVKSLFLNANNFESFIGFLPAEIKRHIIKIVFSVLDPILTAFAQTEGMAFLVGNIGYRHLSISSWIAENFWPVCTAKKLNLVRDVGSIWIGRWIALVSGDYLSMCGEFFNVQWIIVSEIGDITVEQFALFRNRINTAKVIFEEDIIAAGGTINL